jgi:hypothetical protein
MTSYQHIPASRVTPARLALAGTAIFALSLLLIIGGVSLLAGVSATVAMYTGLLGRICFTAGIVLLVLAAVRRLDRR